MARNGSGTYSLPTPFPSGFANGTTIDAPTVNSVLTDLQSALTASVAADGQTPITGNWTFGGYNIIGIGTLGVTNVVATAVATSGGMTVGDTLTVTKGGASIGGTVAATAVTATDMSTGNGMTVGNVLSVSAGGAAITGNSTVTGTLSVTGTATVGTAQIGAGGPTWTAGTGAPAATAPIGSLYSRMDGSVGSALYVSAGGGTWNAVAGV
jgi:hypothetical protein